MVAFINGIITNIPYNYEEVIRRLRLLGLSPIGKPTLDRSRLKTAIDNKVEKIEEKKEIKEREEYSVERQREEERLGAQALAEQNKFFFGL